MRLRKPILQPVAMIVGLGNPGPQYARTRHNVGFDVVETMAGVHRIPIKTSRFQAIYGIGEVRGVVVGLVKPLTFMNNSGRAVAALARHWGIKPQQILIIADDLDMAVGKLRLRQSGSSGGHNGHKSLIDCLGTTEYPRLKIGIGRSDSAVVDHVLEKFTPEERADVDPSLKRAAECAEKWLAGGYSSAVTFLGSDT